MKKSLKTQVKSMEAVLAVCREYPLIIVLLLALSNAVSALGLKIQSIISTEGKQQLDNKGVTITKKQLKTEMVLLGSGIAAAIQAYAQTISDATLFGKMRFQKAIYLKGTDSNAISACRMIYTIVSAIDKADRDPFGVTDAVLTSFKNSIDSYENKGSSSTRNVITNKTALTQMLVTLVNEGNDIMRNEILKLAEQFQEQYPEFYIEVNQAAKLIESTTHTKIRVEATDDVSGNLLAGMKVMVEETGQQGVTNSKGLCLIYLPEGDYHVVISNSKYITMTMEVTVKRGSNTIKAILVPAFDVPAVKKEMVKK